MAAWSFWRECAKRANKGTSAFANDWQWVYGTPIASAVAVYVASNNGATGLTTGYPILDAFLAALAAFLITWAIAFAHRLYKTAPEMFREQKERVSELEEARKPKLKCSFSMHDPGCVRPNTRLGNSGMQGTFFRLKIEAATEVPILGCQGRLTEISRGDAILFRGEKITLPFAYAEEPDAIEKTIHPGVPEHLDFLVIDYGNHLFFTPHGVLSSSVNWKDMFSIAGDYFFHVAIVSPQGPSCSTKILVRWTLNHATSEIKCLT